MSLLVFRRVANLNFTFLLSFSTNSAPICFTFSSKYKIHIKFWRIGLRYTLFPEHPLSRVRNAEYTVSESTECCQVYSYFMSIFGHLMSRKQKKIPLSDSIINSNLYSPCLFCYHLANLSLCRRLVTVKRKLKSYSG